MLVMVGVYTDWFVGAVACALGATALWHAAIDDSAAYRLVKLQWIEQHYGRTRARQILMVTGTLLVLLGVTIILGFKINWSEDAQGQQSKPTQKASAYKFS